MNNNYIETHNIILLLFPSSLAKFRNITTGRILIGGLTGGGGEGGKEHNIIVETGGERVYLETYRKRENDGRTDGRTKTRRAYVCRPAPLVRQTNATGRENTHVADSTFLPGDRFVNIVFSQARADNIAVIIIYHKRFRSWNGGKKKKITWRSRPPDPARRESSYITVWVK